MPDRKHTANYRAHGKEPDSGSATEHAVWNMGNPLEVILFFHLIKLLFNEFIKDGFFQLNSVLVTLVVNHFMNNIALPSPPGFETSGDDPPHPHHHQLKFNALPSPPVLKPWS